MFARHIQTAALMTDRELELNSAEAAIAQQESIVDAELARLTEAAGQLSARLRALDGANDGADPKLADLLGRLRAQKLPALDVERHREKAHAARMEALKVRSQTCEAMKKAAASYAQQLSQIQQAVASAEAEILAAKEREQRRKAEQARMARPPPPLEAVAPRADAPRPTGQRRRQVRVAMQASIDLKSDHNFFTGFSTDISAGGLFIATLEPVDIGTEVDLTFTLPNGQSIQAHGVVRWRREVEVHDKDHHFFPGVGV